MIKAGFVIESPQTGSRTKVLEGDAETNSMGWLLEITCPPNAGPDIAEHIHLSWTETFTIIQGAAHYKLDGLQRTAHVGESFTVLPGQRHVHPWNAGALPMIYRQADRFAQRSPEAVQEVLGAFATIADLARSGQVDKRGLPKNPLQLAATMRTLVKHGGYDASVPMGAQRFLASTLGRLAAWMGYRGVDPRYIGA